MAKNEPNETIFHKSCGLKIDHPAIYCIQVVGYLDNSWSNRLSGLQIIPSRVEGETTVTSLSGLLIDQAALFGVLNALYNMHFPLLSVECLEII